TKEVPLNGRSSLTVSLQSQAVSGEEVVVVGYGTQQRADLTSSIATVDVEKVFEARPISDIGSGLQGSVAGLTVRNSTGEIGTNPSITLRGLQGSLNAPGAQPLILVDGVKVPSLNQVNTHDVESISVLKDAASTAIYGTEAAWGAILITTKSGKRNMEPQVSYSSNFSFSTPTAVPEVAPAADGAEMAFSALQRIDPSTDVFGVVGMYFDQEGIQKMREWEEQYGGQNLSDEMVMGRDFEIRDGRLFFYRPWDAGDKYLRDWTPSQEQYLNVAGGTESTSYNLGLGYVNKKGIVDIGNDKWRRYNINASLQTAVNDWLDLRGKFKFAQRERTEPNTEKGSTYNDWYYLYRWPRTYPYGNYEGKPFRSAVTSMKQAKKAEHTSTLTRVSTGATANLADGLTVDADFTYNRRNGQQHNTGGKFQGYNFWAGGGSLNYGTYTGSSFNNVNYSSGWNRRVNFRSVITYEQDFDEHSLKIMGGGEGEMYEYWSQYSERRGLLDPDKGEIDLAIGDQYVNGSHGQDATLGFFGRLNYSFQDKYLLQINGRFDGSSNFPSNKRWGFFPSASVGYKISEESYMDFAKPALTFLKVRGSYGSVGNNSVGYYPYIATMSNTGSGWLVGDSETETTFGTPSAISSSLTWETVTTLDIGVDARMFEDQLSFTFDWYNRTTSDMLSAGVTLPSTFGTSSPERNYGELQTRGWELEIGWNHSLGEDAFISIEGNLSNFTEEITKYANTTKSIGSYYTGRILGDIWGYETDRFFTRDDFQKDTEGNLITNDEGEYVLKDGTPDQDLYESGWFSYGPGDIKYKDIDGDGKITYGENTVGNSGDRKVIGNSTPKYQYGLRISGGWKGFDLSMFLQGVGKRDYWANGPMFVPGWRAGEAWYDHQMDYWTPENQDAFYPRPTSHSQSNAIRNFMPQTRYLLDMSYLRMKNITIGYTLPVSLMSRVNIEKLRIYISGENLFEFDNLGDIPIDPETGIAPGSASWTGSFGRNYPFQRVVSVGLNLTF
ncbi:MAG TPA: SusC/RagA family TonB-linked outer membrane protein, partial [Fodinibius sp.]|nr:SusC/RagA family TonB-linked outer membrane protein [Fodinibius sp.]